jgi:hypothetical protein
MMTRSFVRLSISEVLEETFCLHLKENKTTVNSLMKIFFFVVSEELMHLILHFSEPLHHNEAPELEITSNFYLNTFTIL